MNIKQFRKSQGITQEELAERIGVHENTIRLWEKGMRDPRSSDIQKLCEVLHCTEAELLNGPSEDKIRVTLSYDVSKLKEGEIDMESNGFDLFLGKNGFIGLRGGIKMLPGMTIDDVMSEIRKEFERGLALQESRGAIQQA